jgi:glycosyltransferase 2 family protein
MDEEAKAYFYKAIRETNYFWIIISLILSFFAFAVRAYRWKYVLEPLGFKTKFWNRYHALMIGYVVNLTIPRAGEASRSAMLYRSDGIPFSKSFGTIVAERAVDLCMLTSVSLLTAYFNYNDFNVIFTEIQSTFSNSETDGFPWKIVLYGVFGLGFITLIFLMIFNQKWKTKLLSFVKDVFQGVFSIFNCKNPWAYIGFTLLIWVLYISYFGISFLSIEDTKDFPLSGIMLAFIAGSLGITFTNGGIGAFPILIGLVVNFVLSDSNPNAHAVGNALGMIIWSSQTLLVIILGLISLLLLPKNFEKEHVEQIGNVEK